LTLIIMMMIIMMSQPLALSAACQLQATMEGSSTHRAWYCTWCRQQDLQRITPACMHAMQEKAFPATKFLHQPSTAESALSCINSIQLPVASVPNV
jgi:thiamine biosynthesis lipoprotein ApbE